MLVPCFRIEGQGDHPDNGKLEVPAMRAVSHLRAEIFWMTKDDKKGLLVNIVSSYHFHKIPELLHAVAFAIFSIFSPVYWTRYLQTLLADHPLCIPSSAVRQFIGVRLIHHRRHIPTNEQCS